MFDALAFVLAIIGLTIVAPLYLLLHFITRWRSQRVLNSEEESDIEELWQLCERLEKRVDNIEQIVGEQKNTA